MTSQRLLCQKTLPNGLNLELLDHSRPLAGDRWLVKLEVRVAIPVAEAHLPPDLKERYQEVVEALGPEVIFRKEDVRHFIDQREVPELREKMQARLLQGLLAYLGHPDFAGRYLRKKFAEYEERQRWYRD
jgi:hypothetical protein